MPQNLEQSRWTKRVIGQAGVAPAVGWCAIYLDGGEWIQEPVACWAARTLDNGFQDPIETLTGMVPWGGALADARSFIGFYDFCHEDEIPKRAGEFAEAALTAHGDASQAG